MLFFMVNSVSRIIYLDWHQPDTLYIAKSWCWRGQGEGGKYLQMAWYLKHHYLESSAITVYLNECKSICIASLQILASWEAHMDFHVIIVINSKE